MSHPLVAKFEAASAWRAHLRERCRANPNLFRAETAVRIADIQSEVAEFFGVSVAAMISRDQHEHFCTPRHIAMYLAREFTKKSYPTIARSFKRKNHTSVVAACRKIETLMLTDPPVRGDIETLARRIRGAK